MDEMADQRYRRLVARASDCISDSATVPKDAFRACYVYLNALVNTTPKDRWHQWRSICGALDDLKRVAKPSLRPNQRRTVEIATAVALAMSDRDDELARTRYAGFGGRPATGVSREVRFRADDELRSKIVSVAAQERISASALIRQILEDALYEVPDEA